MKFQLILLFCFSISGICGNDLFKVAAPRTEMDLRRSFEKFLMNELKESLPDCDPERLRPAVRMMVMHKFSEPMFLTVNRNASEQEKRAFQAWNEWRRARVEGREFDELIETWKSPWCAVIFGNWAIRPPRDQLSRYMNLLVSAREKPELQRYLWHLAGRLKMMDIYEEIQKLPEDGKVDPWYDKICNASVEQEKAWSARGCGWASTVSEEGWKGFYAHMENSIQAFAEAREMRPEWPEAAGWLVGTMASSCSGREHMEPLLKAAVRAQVDDAKTWRSVFWYSRARWGGSPDKIRNYAELCLNADIPDSELGLIGICGLFEAFSDNEDYCSAFAFTPENLPLARKALDELDRMDAYPRAKRDLFRAMTEYAFGNFDEAFKAFERSNPRRYTFNRYHFISLQGWELFWMHLPSLHKVMTGKHGADFTETERLRMQGQRRQTIEKLLEIIKIPDLGEFEKEFAIRQYGLLKSEIGVGSINEYNAIAILSGKTHNNRYLPLIRELLQLGANPNARSHWNTPLLYDMVSYQATPEAVKIVIEAGGDVTLKNGSGETLLQHAKNRGYRELVAVLEEAEKASSPSTK